MPAVTPAAGVDVLTYHNDTSRTGANLNETTLTPQNVNASSFGKLFHYTVDGQVYAQPLEVSQVRMGDGQVHNVLIVATENDSVYAFDANDPTAGPRHNGILWQTSFIDPAKGITTVPAQDVENNGVGPTYGITATPVIDGATGTIYVVSQVKVQPTDAGGPHYVQQFHALNLVNGKEMDGGPATIGDTTLHADGSFTNDTALSVPGTGAGSADGVVKFNALRQLPRMGLVLDMNVPGHPDGVVFTGSASDGDIDPYHGWLIGYDAKTLKLVTFFNTTPNGDFGGIWQAGGAPAVASNGDLILGSGNGTFDAFTTTTPAGPAAQGESGFGLGSSGIHQSAAVSFAASIPSTGVASTGLFFNGDTPTDQPVAPDVNQPLAGTGIDFTAGAEDPNGPHTYQATLSYSGTTLTETITDQTTGATFNHAYQNVDLPASVGGNTAFVGFGGGTDGRTATQAITSWTYSSGGQTLIDHSSGFASHGDLTATGVATFNGTAADLTVGGGQSAGNVFANGRVNIQNFSTTFTFQIQHQGSGPIGDGLTFIIQNDTGHRPGPDFGESSLRLSPTPGTMTVVDSFTPFDFKNRDIHDTDTSSTGVTLLPAFPGTAHPNLAVTADKSGTIRLIDVDNMGGFNPGGPDRVLQEFTANPHGLIYSSPVYFDGKVYIQGVGDVLKAFALKLDPATNTMLLDETPVSQGTTVSGFPGEVQSVSANGTTNGIVWEAQVDGFATGSPAILRAYDANDLSTPLYASNQAGPRDTAGGGIKFSTPTIANGHVYLGTQTEVDVYGLLGQSASPGKAQPGTVQQTNLVSDLPGMAAVTDPNLVNPWGISESATSPFWLSDNGAGVSTLYNTPGQNGAPIAINPLVVSIPTPSDPLGPDGTTGTVFNSATGGFQVGGFSKTGAPASAAAAFLFVTEDGTIVGWNPGVNPTGFDPAKAGTYGIIAVDNSGNNFTKSNPLKQTGAVYKGMSIATSASPIFAGDANSTGVIYAANFRSGKVEVYDSNFKAVVLPAGAFTDPKVPKGYAPFDVEVLNGKVYVTYAQQDAASHDDVAGQGHGFVDVFNLDGTPGLDGGKVRLITRGQLDSPWGLAIAPAGFAGLSAPHNDPVLLVGNFGDGRINAFDASTGQFLTQLKGPDGKPIQIDGLWALKVGNGGAGGNANTVYFTAGPDGETHGLFGSLSSVSASGSSRQPAAADSGTLRVDQKKQDAFLQTNLVSNVPGMAQITDPDLKNPWGVSESPTSPFWVSNQGTNTSTLYSVTAAGVSKVPLTVAIPQTAAGPQGPTGQVANTTMSFVLNGKPANFIFADLNGAISAWNGGATATVESTTPGAVYTGLAIATDAAGSSFLYAADGADNRIDVFNGSFARQTLPAGAFVDPQLPKKSNLVPFNVQNIGGHIFVTYAPAGHTAQVEAKKGQGAVAEFDTAGHFIREVVSGSRLASPWGITMAPASFGKFGGDLLVGNFAAGSGEINAFDPVTGKFLGTLSDAGGMPIRNSALWYIGFGNGGSGGDPNTLYFTAGIDGEADGLFGSIAPIVV